MEEKKRSGIEKSGQSLNIASKIISTQKYGLILHFIGVFTVVFSLEVALRIWTADLLDHKYEEFFDYKH